MILAQREAPARDPESQTAPTLPPIWNHADGDVVTTVTGRLILCTALAAVTAGCGSTASQEATTVVTRADERRPTPPEAAVRKSTVSAPAPRRCLAGAVRRLNGGERATALVLDRPTTAHRTPGGVVLARFGKLNVNGVPTVFRALETRTGADCAPAWYRVQLPIRPNGATGWIKATGTHSYTVDTRITIDLSERRVSVYRRGRLVERVAAGIGKPATPTPLGRYYVNQRLLAADPTGPWGPGGIGISAFSPVLVDWVQGGPIAIHGTNRPESIGLRVSFGCVRVANDDLRRLMKLAPPGTPVQIRS